MEELSVLLRGKYCTQELKEMMRDPSMTFTWPKKRRGGGGKHFWQRFAILAAC